MKINVYFKNYLLGSLTKGSGGFVYNSNTQGELEFKNNTVSSAFYELYNSKNAQLKELPAFLQEYLQMTKNDFFITHAEISLQDDDFTKLYKLSKLRFDDMGFYIKAE